MTTRIVTSSRQQIGFWGATALLLTLDKEETFSRDIHTGLTVIVGVLLARGAYCGTVHSPGCFAEDLAQLHEWVLGVWLIGPLLSVF